MHALATIKMLFYIYDMGKRIYIHLLVAGEFINMENSCLVCVCQRLVYYIEFARRVAVAVLRKLKHLIHSKFECKHMFTFKYT